MSGGSTSSQHEKESPGEMHSDLKRAETKAESVINGNVVATNDHLQRHIGNRQVQLIAIGGSIGTATFVSIGTGLARGGPVSLVLAYTLYSCMLGLVNNSMAEMSVYMPTTGAFIRLAGHCKLKDEQYLVSLILNFLGC
jgi:amino acid transporter